MFFLISSESSIRLAENFPARYRLMRSIWRSTLNFEFNSMAGMIVKKFSEFSALGLIVTFP